MHPPAPAPPPASYVRPDVQAFLAYLNALPGPRTHELDPPGARALYLRAKDVGDLPVGDLAVVRDLVIPGPAGDIPARLFDSRERREPGPVVVFYHGGGFVIGDIDSHAGVAAEFARTLDLPVVSVGYRLAPEHPWPAAPDDAEAAARWIAEGPAALDRVATSLVVAGDSAGGTLAIVAAMDLRDRPAAVPVIAQLLLYPATDALDRHPSYAAFAEGHLLTAPVMRWFDDHYRADRSHPRGAPLSGDPAGLPPALVLTASLDPIRDSGRAYAAALARAGVAVTFREAVGTIHGFANLRRGIPSAVGDLAGFLVAGHAIVGAAEAQRVMVQAAAAA